MTSELNTTAVSATASGPASGGAPVTRGPGTEVPIGGIRLLRAYGRLWKRAGKNTVVLMASGFLGILSFAVLTPLFALSIGTAAIWLGIPALAGTLVLAHYFASANRSLLRWRGDRIEDSPPLHTRPRLPGLMAGIWQRLKEELTSRERWLELLHGIVPGILELSGLILAPLWWGVALAETFALAWVPMMERIEPGSVNMVGDLLAGQLESTAGIEFSHGLIDTAIGLVLLALAPLIMEGWALLYRLEAKAMLQPRSSARQRIHQLETARSKAAAAETAALRSVERDLHDGPQQALISVGMDLAAAERRLAEGDASAAQELIEQAKKRNNQALADLRALSRGIAPPTLAQRGLLAAITVAAASCDVPVTLTGFVREGERFREVAETVVYFAAAELLANVAKHARASAVAITLDYADGCLVLTVHDDGRGGAQVLPGHGLAGLMDRLAGVDGTLEIVGTVESMGTMVRATVPAG
jgi:signal transduction histidine kinase